MLFFISYILSILYYTSTYMYIISFSNWIKLNKEITNELLFSYIFLILYMVYFI